VVLVTGIDKIYHNKGLAVIEEFKSREKRDLNDKKAGQA
jgi:hypothetical protein